MDTKEYLLKTASDAYDRLYKGDPEKFNSYDRFYTDSDHRFITKFLKGPAIAAGLAGIAGGVTGAAAHLDHPSASLKGIGTSAALGAGLLGGLAAGGTLLYNAITEPRDRTKAKNYLNGTPLAGKTDGSSYDYKTRVRPYLNDINRTYLNHVEPQINQDDIAYARAEHTVGLEPKGLKRDILKSNILANITAHKNYRNRYGLSGIIDNISENKMYRKKYGLPTDEALEDEVYYANRDRTLADRHALAEKIKENPNIYVDLVSPEPGTRDREQLDHRARLQEQSLFEAALWGPRY